MVQTLSAQQSDASGPSSSLRRSLVVVGLGLVLSTVAFVLSRRLESDLIEADFNNVTADRITAVSNALENQMDLLRSVASMLQTFPAATSEHFRQYVEPLLPLQTGLVAIGWAPYIRHDQREQAIAALNVQGPKPFVLRERSTDGRLVVAGVRPDYAPVVFLEPLEANINAWGFDLMSEANRRATLEAARDSGQIQTTRRLQLVQDRTPRDSLLSAIPIYRTGASPNTVSKRRSALSGFVTKVYWVDELIVSGLDVLTAGGVDLAFFDPAEGPEAPAFYVHRSRTRAEQYDDRAIASSLSFRGEVDVGGRLWQVVGTPAPAFYSSRRGFLPWLLAGIGLVATALVQSYLALQQRRARQSEAAARRLQDLVFHMPVMLLALDEHHRIVVWNRMCEQVTGYDAQEMIENPGAFALINLSSEAQEAGDAGLPMRRDFERVPVRARDRNNVEYVVEWTNVSNALPIPGWDCWFIGVDVTEREKMHQQLLQRQKLESLGVLAGGVAHDFNNLLTAIMGNASLAQLSLDEDSPTQKTLEAVIDASERASKLTQQLLAYAGKSSMQPTALDVASLVADIEPMLQSLLPTGVALRLSVAENLSQARGDVAHIEQLLTSLVTNAGESFDDRKGYVQLSIQETEFGQRGGANPAPHPDLKPGHYLCLQISDQGHGMDAETRKKIFDPFFSTKFAGRGLGLAAAHGIARSHGGAIDVQSSPGEGAVVTVHLPVFDNPATDATTDASPEATPGVILIVDDEQAVADLARAGLKRLGYDVLLAADGAQAIDVFRAQGGAIDCVVLDMNMPGMGGDETLAALRELRPDVRVLLSSGYPHVEDTMADGEQGLTWFLQKPYTPVRLAGKIEQVLKA